MGGFITKQLAWRDLSHLEEGDVNDRVLEKILAQLQLFCSASTVLANVPIERLEWESAVAFRSFATGSSLLITEADRIVGVDKDPATGEPLYLLRKITDSLVTARVASLRYLEEHLRLAGAARLTELRRIIEDCRPQLAEVTSVNAHLDISVYDSFPRVNLLFPDVVTVADAKLCVARDRFELMIALNAFDLNLMLASLKESSERAVKVTVDMMQREIKMLQQLAGREVVTDCLVSVDADREIQFEGDVRVPAYRQIRGDLSYLCAVMHDVGTLNITASARGYFLNRGAVPDGRGSLTLNFEAASPIYPTLLELFKTKSPHFLHKLESRFIAVEEEPRAVDLYPKRSPSMLSSARPYGLNTPTQSLHQVGSPSVSGKSPELHRQMTPPQPFLRNRSMSTISLLSNQSGKGSMSPLLPPVPLERRGSFGTSPSQAANLTYTPLPTMLDVPHHKDVDDDNRSQVSNKSGRSRHSSRSKSSSRRASSVNAGGAAWSMLRDEQTAAKREKKEVKLSVQGRDRTHSDEKVQRKKSSDMSPVLAAAIANRQRRASFAATSPHADQSQQLAVPSADRGTLRDSLARLHDQFRSRPSMQTDAVYDGLGLRNLLQTETRSEKDVPRAQSPREKLAPPLIASPVPLLEPASTSTTARKRRVKKDVDSSDEESAELESMVWEPPTPPAEMTADHVQIHKLCKLLKGGDPTTTVVALASLQQFDLKQRKFQLAVRDVGGLEPLVLLLSAAIPKIRIGAAEILRDITLHPHLQLLFNQLDGIAPLIEMLTKNHVRETAVAAAALESLAFSTRNCRDIRRSGGVMHLLNAMRTHSMKNTTIVKNCARALWNVSKKESSKVAIVEANGMSVLVSLLNDKSEEVLIPVCGILAEITTRLNIRAALYKTDMLKNVVRHMLSDNTNLQTQCALILYNCNQDIVCRQQMSTGGALRRLVELTRATDTQLITAATGALWRAGRNEENVLVMNKLDCVNHLVNLLGHRSEEIQTNSAGCLSNIGTTKEGRDALRGAGGVQRLIAMLTATDDDLLANAAYALANAAEDRECNKLIIRTDGLRLLWSLLKSPNSHVQAMGAMALAPVINDETNIELRSFVGGLPLIVQLLQSDSEEVQAYVCGTIANIAKDEQNISIMSEYRVVELLSRLVHTKSNHVRRNLALAVGRCCPSGVNCTEFGELGICVPLVEFLRAKDSLVHRSTAFAMYKLSDDAANAATLREANAVELLVQLMSSRDYELQSNAAGTIANIRRWHLAFSEQGPAVLAQNLSRGILHHVIQE